MDGVWGELGGGPGGQVQNAQLESLSLETHANSGYHGQPVHFINDDVYVFKSGNSLVFRNIVDQSESTFWNSGVGLATYAVNRRQSIFAYSNTQAPPIIFIHEYPSMALVATLKDGTDLAYKSLDFSRDGTRLASLGDVPDQLLTVWNWEAQETLIAANVADHVTGPTGDTLSFSPANKDLLCLTGDGPAVIWKIDENYQNFTISTVTSKLHDDSGAAEELIPSVHAWTPTNELYLGCHTGELFLISAETGELSVPNSISLKSGGHADDGTAGGAGGEDDEVGVTALVLTRNHIVTLDSESFIRWYSRSDHLLCWTQRLPVQEASRLVASPDYTTFLAGSATGYVHQVRVTRDVPTTMVDVDSEEFTDLVVIDEVSSSHSGHISSLVAIPGTPYVISGAHDGALAVWDIAEGSILNKTSLSRPITSMTITSRGDLLAVGTITGVVRVFRLSAEHNYTPELVFRTRIHSKAVTALAWNVNGSYLLSGSHDSRVFFIQRNDQSSSGSEPLRVMSYVQLRAPVSCATWSLDREDQFFVSLHNADVLRMILPPADEEKIAQAQYEVDIKAFNRSLMKMSFPGTRMAMVPGGSVANKYYQFYIFATDKKVKLYTMLEDTGDPDLVDDDTLTPPDTELEGHDKTGLALTVSHNAQFLATGSQDGTVCIRSASALEQALFDRALDNLADGVTAVVFTADDSYIVLGGGDGTLVFKSCRNRAPKAAVEVDPGLGPFQLVGDPYPDLDDLDDEESFLEARKLEIIAADEALHSAAREKMREHVTNLKVKFRELLKKNETVPELEQLGRDDFVVDFTARDKLVAEGDKQVVKAREEIQKKNVALELIAHRIREECWDTMEVKGVTISAFDDNAPSVSNYAVRVTTKEEVAHVEQIKAMRRGELFGQRLDAHDAAVAERRANAGNQTLQQQGPSGTQATLISESGGADDGKDIGGTGNDKGGNGADGQGNGDSGAGNGGAAGLDGDGSHATLPPEGGAGGAGAGHPSVSAVIDDDDDDDIDAYEMDLLYDPLELFTRQRKNTQIVLLQDQIRHHKEVFNKSFERFLDSKAQELDKISQKSQRINQIATELKVDKPVFITELNSDEVPSRVLGVRDEEVTVERVLSQAERERLEEEERRKAEALAGQKRDDSAERALRQMMGGKLQESTDERALEEDLVKPEWMETTPAEDLSDDQKKEIAAFEAEVERRALEKEKHRKALETELKKLKTQVAELQEGFDTRLQQMLEQRAASDTIIYQHELNIIQLSRSLLREENDKLQEERLLHELEALKREKGRTASTLTEFKREVDQYREAVENLVMQDKVMEKTFRKDFADADEFLDPLFRLFRRRHKQRAGGERQVRTPDVADPFAKYDLDEGEGGAGGVRPGDELDRESDAPEGLPDHLWDRLLEARRRKLESEAEIRRRNVVLQEIIRYQTMLTDEDETARLKIDQLLSRLSAFRDERLKLAANLEKLFSLKQGQVEVEQEAVVTDYGDAVLINRTVVQQLNDKIQELGRDKVVYLQQIKDIRKTIHELDWENTKLDMEAEDLLQKTRDFQLLRVTKALQELIKGGGTNKHAAEIAMLEKKSEHSKKVHEEKVLEKKRTLAKLKKLIREKENDNRKLEDHIEHLEVSVSERRNIYELQTHTTGGETEEDKSFNRFKDIIKQRRLLDLAKAQTEEIEFLQEELERLRQATFPSFAVAHTQDRHPDQRIR